MTCHGESEVKKVFDAIDTDGSGFISKDELATLLKKLNQVTTDQELDLMFKAAAKGDDKIDFKEFCAKFETSFAPPSNDDLQESFHMMDVNGDGKLIKSEIKTGLLKVGEPVTDATVDDMVGAADKDGDGVVSWEEFLSMLDTDSPPPEFELLPEEARLFESMDEDHSGSLTGHEVVNGMSKLYPVGPREEQEFLKWDKDGDGIISSKEFGTRYDPAKRVLQQKWRSLTHAAKLVEPVPYMSVCGLLATAVGSVLLGRMVCRRRARHQHMKEQELLASDTDNA